MRSKKQKSNINPINGPLFGGPFFFVPWEQRKVSEMAQIVGGGTPSTVIPEYWNGTVNWFAPAEMEGVRYAVESTKKITELGLTKSSARLLPPNRTVLFTSRAGIGKMAILCCHAATNQGFQSMVLSEENNPYFVYSMQDIIKTKAENVASGSTFLEISGKTLGNLILTVPQKLEQDQIATFFQHIDDLITLHQRKFFCKNWRIKSIFAAKKRAITWEQRELWTLTTWDKKYNEVESEKQPSTIKYPYVLAEVFSKIEDDAGSVRLLSTGSYIGYTTEKKAGENLCEGEIVAIPWGGTPNVKYYKGKFVTADNRIAVSSDQNTLRTKHIALWMQAHISLIETFYRGASIKHPSMSDILNMVIDYPTAAEQDKISECLFKLDDLITLHQCKYFKDSCDHRHTLREANIQKQANTWEQRKVGDIFKITRGYVLAATETSEIFTDDTPFPVYSSQTKDNGLMGYYSDYLYADAITWTTDGANAGTVRYRGGKFYCTNVCGVLLRHTAIPNQMIAESINNVSRKYVSYVGNPKLMNNVMAEITIKLPKSTDEQKEVSTLFYAIDNLITLHQCKELEKRGLEVKHEKNRNNRNSHYTWEQREYGDCFDERQERSAEGELISVTMSEGIKKFSELNRHDNSSEDKSHYKKVEIGDIAYNSMRMWQGASGYSPFSGILSPAYTVLVPKEGTCSRFFSYLMKRPTVIHLFKMNSQGITSDTWNLKYPELSELPCVVPKEDEQEDIARIFKQIDSLITLHQCKELKKNRIMAKRKNNKWNRKQPHAWEQCKLGDMGETFTGLSGKTKEDFGHGDGRFITYMNVFSNPIARGDIIEPIEIDDNQESVHYGDVLFTTSSETPEEVGMSSVWLENRQNTYLNSFCFGFRPQKTYYPQYLAYMLRSPSVREKICFLGQGISRYNISKNKMMEIFIINPSWEEQKALGTLHLMLDNLITLHQRGNKYIQETKK